MFVVTGASGQLGRGIVTRLARLVPPDRIVATCRDPGKAADLSALGVHLRRGDFADPASLRSAFAGAERVLIVSSSARSQGGDTLAQHRDAIAAACEAGAARLLYTSHMAASETSAFPPMRDHAATETMLQGCGTAWTALRNGFYMASGLNMLREARETGTLAVAADGPVAWTAHADLAEAAARIMVDPPSESGPTRPLTGAETLDLSALAAILSELTARPITRDVLSDDEMQDRLAARHVPAAVAAIATGFCIAARQGEFAALDPALGAVLQRPPIRMREFIAWALASD